jgi:acylphosphatase
VFDKQKPVDIGLEPVADRIDDELPVRRSAAIAYNLANMAKEQRVIKIHGKVQGVGYRFFATRVARRLGLKGSIENIRDGYVEAIVEGEKNVIDEWIEELKEGPRYAEVTSIDQESKDYTGRLGDFDVKF